MNNVSMIFSDDLQAAAEAAVKNICYSIDMRVVIVATHSAINERWRRAISGLGNAYTIAVVRGSVKEKDKAIRSNARIIFASPGSAGRILTAKGIKADVLIVDDLEGLVKIRKEFRNNISALAHNTAQIIGINCSLNGENLRYLPEILRIMGMEEIKGMPLSGFYERYYFRDYLRKDKFTICRLELKPGAVEAVKRVLGETCDMQLINKADTKDMDVSGYEEYIPLDYKEKSRYGFMKWIREEKAYGKCIGNYNDQYV